MEIFGAGSAIGGISGYLSKGGNLDNCHNNGKIRGRDAIGEIYGSAGGNDISMNYCTYKITATSANSNNATAMTDLTSTMSINNFVSTMNSRVQSSSSLNLREWELRGEYPMFKE